MSCHFEANPVPCTNKNCKSEHCFGQGDPWKCYEKAKRELYGLNLTPSAYDKHIRQIVCDLGV